MEETYLKQFTQKLLLSIEETNDNLVQNGKTYINKESILKLLTIKNHQLSEPKNYQLNNNSNNNNNNNEEKHDNNKEIDIDSKGIDWLPVSQTIRFDDSSLTPMMNTQYSHSMENLGDIKEELSEYDDSLQQLQQQQHIDDISYIDWTNYAIHNLQFAEEEKLEYYSNKELFIVLSKYVLIYSKPGDKNGVPRDLSIIGILNKYDLVLIAAKQRDYTTECYVRCLLPIQGWIFLPQTIIDKWISSDKMTISHHGLQLSTNYSSNQMYASSENHLNNNNSNKFYHGSNFHEIDVDYIYKIMKSNNNDNNKNSNKNQHIWKKLEDDKNHINFLDQQIVPLTHPLPPELMKKDSDTKENKDDNNDDEEDEKSKDKDRDKNKEEKGKCAQRITHILQWIVRWMRKHPFFPGLLITIIQAVIEFIIFFDVVTDVIVVIQLSQISSSLLLSLFFTFSVIFLVSPYMIGWVSTTQWMLRRIQKRKLEKHKKRKFVEKFVERGKCNRYLWKSAFILFNIAPIGILSLFIGDIIHLLEYVILRPIAYLVSCLSICNKCKYCKLRTISFEELGYWKLRRVSEIFAETIPMHQI